MSSERVPVREAAGRILRVSEHSKVDLPPFDKAAVDGYAVLAGDHREEYRLLGTIAAGELPRSELAPGTTVKVMTGAPVPPGTAKVIMVEQARERGGLVRFVKPGAAGNICRRAEDVARGQEILPAGSRLRALEIANLISCGVTDVKVSRRLNLSIISTGDELVDSPGLLAPGKIMNTNGPLLRGLAEKFALRVMREETVADHKSDLVAALERSLTEADIVVMSGAVSAGDYDFGPAAITASGLDTHFSRVAVKPGMPTTFATGARAILFGLPGNPVAVYLTFHLFVLRAAARLSGARYEPKSFRLRLVRSFSRRSTSRQDYYPCRISSEGLAEPTSYHGSADLAAVMRADGFLVLPPGPKSLETGTEAAFVTFDGESGWETADP